MTTGANVVAEARKYYGVPYLWGGTDLAHGVDCSGFAQAIHKNLGIAIPRDTTSQWAGGVNAIPFSQVQAGDCVYFGTAAGVTEHMGIVTASLGGIGGTMINAPHAGSVVRDDTYASGMFGDEKVMGYKRWYDGPQGTVTNTGFSFDPTQGLSSMADNFTKLLQLAELPIKAAVWVAQRKNLVRVIEGMLGAAAIALGIYMVNADTINSMVGAVSKPAAKLALA